MIKREHIKDAIDAIAKRDPGAGYSLSQMLDQGIIDIPSQQDRAIAGNRLYFLFGGREVPVNRFVFFNEGITPIEQALLVEYGELLGKENLRRDKRDAGYRAMSQEIREEGLRFMVCHEIDYAIERIKKRFKGRETVASQPGGIGREVAGIENEEARLIARLERIKQDRTPLDTRKLKGVSSVWYEGFVGGDRNAIFTSFPYCMAALMQVADLKLEFFHVRFLLNCLIRGLANNIFACLVDEGIVGLVLIGVGRKPFYPEIEIKYIATLSSSPNSLARGSYRDVKGVGTFLVSGVWLLGENELGGVKAITLDSEIGARGFYEALGFKSHGLAGYVLKRPEGLLFKSILTTANRAERLTERAVRDINSILSNQVRLLGKKPKKKKEEALRDIAVACVRECLKPGSRLEFARTAMWTLIKCRERIPEAEALLELGLKRIPSLRAPDEKGQPVLVVQDDRFKLHLDGIPHLECPRRIEATNSLLQDPSIYGKWLKVEPRPASVEELAMVHTLDYIRQVAETEGKPLASFDLDTQATARSYEVGRLAGGSLCNLLEEVCSGKGRRGFAFVRPPGHHAGANRAMGFCLFNNVAIGAKYLIERKQAEKVMIIDIDVHHGNGTQAIFYDTDRVLYASIHQFPAYPGTGALGEVGRGKGEGFTANIPLRKGCGDREVCSTIHFILEPMAREYGPDMILVSCGFDLYIYDRLGGMRVTPEGYALIASFLVRIADRASDGRIVFVMEGGYNLKGIRECGLRVMQVLCGLAAVDQKKIDGIRESGRSKLSFLKKAMEIHKQYWKTLS
ncbi:MAG: histone deacetylase [Deltaproteobacteria bacterium]|nr:histone deacetylase [Deltaproteobacteria bacterium]MBW2064825.1 histone deacetylase [Deltaproteobacteria bacterium]